MRVAGFSSFYVLLSASVCLAHGPQIQITFNQTTGKIETREIVDTENRPTEISGLKRVYVMPFMELSGGAGSGWYTRPDQMLNGFGVPEHPTGPGITYQYDEAAQLPGTGWSFSGSSTLPNLQGSNFGYRFNDGYKLWDGSSFVDPGVEQFQMFRGDGTTVPSIMASTTDASPFAAMALSAISSKNSNAHHSVGYRMLGDGTSFGLTGPAAGDDGIYLASLLLTSTASSVGTCEPFYYVIYKNTDPRAAVAAAESLGFSPELIQVVPEPTTLALMLLGGAIATRRSRR